MDRKNILENIFSFYNDPCNKNPTKKECINDDNPKGYANPNSCEKCLNLDTNKVSVLKNVKTGLCYNGKKEIDVRLEGLRDIQDFKFLNTGGFLLYDDDLYGKEKFDGKEIQRTFEEGLADGGYTHFYKNDPTKDKKILQNPDAYSTLNPLDDDFKGYSDIYEKGGLDRLGFLRVFPAENEHIYRILDSNDLINQTPEATLNFIFKNWNNKVPRPKSASEYDWMEQSWGY